MTPAELQLRIADHEDNFTERKAEGTGSAWRRTIVSFANSVPEGRVAHLLIGVADDGSILGCSNPDNTQKTIRKICDSDCYPRVEFSSEVVTTDSGAVVVVSIPASTNRPHFSGPAYVRRGSESVAASHELFDEMVHGRNAKTGAILKLKNTVVSLIGLGHKLGSTRRTAQRDYHENGEGMILGCDAHVVRFQLLNTQEHMSEPLEHVQISYDEAKYRPKLIITGP